jgi:very-short-patch-repair endonuclease
VRATLDSDATIEGLCRALLPILPSGAFFSSVTAAILHGMPLPQFAQKAAGIHVAVFAPARALRARGVVGHSVSALGEDVEAVRGLPVGSPTRTWLELARVLDLPRLVAAGDSIIHWREPRATSESLAAAVAAYPERRGKRALRAAMELLDARAESAPESELRVILSLAGIRGLVANHPVRVGSQRFRIDLALPEWKIAIEYQGDYHRDIEQWRRDMTRISRLESDGWFVVQINANDLWNPGERVERLRRVIARRSRR